MRKRDIVHVTVSCIGAVVIIFAGISAHASLLTSSAPIVGFSVSSQHRGVDSSFHNEAVAASETETTRYTPVQELGALRASFTTVFAGRRGLLGTYPDLAFDDEFKANAIVDEAAPVSTGKWFTPGHSTFGWAQFQEISAFPSIYVVENGKLRLRLQKIDGRWRGAHMSSVNSQNKGFTLSLGYVEARIKVAQEPGGWSGFWMTSTESLTTGMHGEIDIVESYGSATYGYNSSIHIWPGSHPPAKATHVPWAIGAYPRVKVAADDRYHVYGCELTDQWVVFYLDGAETARLRRAPELTDGPWRIFLDLAGGPVAANKKLVSPIDMYVDYVKVWTRVPKS
jgi:beta-glucanase (GH16 family)